MNLRHVICVFEGPSIKGETPARKWRCNCGKGPWKSWRRAQDHARRALPWEDSARPKPDAVGKFVPESLIGTRWKVSTDAGNVIEWLVVDTRIPGRSWVLECVSDEWFEDRVGKTVHHTTRYILQRYERLPGQMVR